jgi:hypothetical protein
MRCRHERPSGPCRRQLSYPNAADHLNRDEKKMHTHEEKVRQSNDERRKAEDHRAHELSKADVALRQPVMEKMTGLHDEQRDVRVSGSEHKEHTVRHTPAGPAHAVFIRKASHRATPSARARRVFGGRPSALPAARQPCRHRLVRSLHHERVNHLDRRLRVFPVHFSSSRSRSRNGERVA